MTADAQPLETRCSVAVFRGDEILLVRSTEDGTEVWKLPGGHVHAHEGYYACAIRELYEETGLRAEQLRGGVLLDCHYEETGRHVGELVMIAVDPSGEVRQCEDGLEPCFVTVERARTMELRPAIAAHLRGLRAMSGEPAPHPGPGGRGGVVLQDGHYRVL